MVEKKVISLIQLPASIQVAVQEQAARFPKEYTFADEVTEETAVVLCGEAADMGSAVCPVVRMGKSSVLRLGGLLAQIGRALQSPALYTEDCDVADCLFSARDKTLIALNGEEVKLTEREADILLFFLRRKNVTVGRATLLENVWKYREGVDTHTLETHIYRLRQKLESVCAAKDVLQTIEGGYRLVL